MRRIGSRYRITEEVPLGRGASGIVYQGEDEDGERFAIKVLHEHLSDDSSVVARFTHERHVLAGVRDPHVVAIRDLIAEGSTLAVVMDYVEGETLKDWITNSRDATVDDVARIGSDIARGLAALHAADVVHRDLKPANVLIDERGDPRITDFGISTLLDEGEDATSAMGTPLYIAPETLRLDSVTGAADVYALGLMLYEMSAGVPAFSGSSRQVAKAQLELMPGRLEYLPDKMWQLLEACLSKNPEVRPSAARVAAQLERLRGDLGDDPPLPRLSAPPVPQAVTREEKTQALATQAMATMPMSPEPSQQPAPYGTSPAQGRRGPVAVAVPVVVGLLLIGAAAALLISRQQSTAQMPVSSAKPTRTVAGPTMTVTTTPRPARQVASLSLCDGQPYPFRTPLNSYNAGSTLAEAQASGDSASIRRATAMASIQAAWRAAGERGPTNGKLFAALGDLGEQGTMLLAQIQDAEGITPTGQVDARTWNVLQEWYC